MSDAAASPNPLYQLRAVFQVAFGWGGEHLHRFVIHGVEYGISYLGGPGFRDDARGIRLGELGLRVERIQPGEPGRAHPRCTGGRRAGPPEEWDGPWAFVEQTQPHHVFDAIVRAAEMMGSAAGRRQRRPVQSRRASR